MSCSVTFDLDPKSVPLSFSRLAVLHAMKEDSEKVPSLLTDYILKGESLTSCILSGELLTDCILTGELCDTVEAVEEGLCLLSRCINLLTMPAHLC